MSLLFTPLQLNGMRLENRIVLPAMVTRLSGEDGLVNQAITDRYVRFAKGEPGMIVLEAMAVHGSRSGPLLRLSSDEFVPGLAELARRIHGTSPSKVVPQIIHFLKVARSGWRQTVDMLSKAEIQDIVRQYAAAAYRARQAGLDGVELHMAHAYTLSSFLSKRSNIRTDEYDGRTLEGRLRLACEVVTAVRAAVGPSFAVGVRFLGDECIKGGYSTNEAKVIALRLAQLGVDYISLSAGGKFEDHVPREGRPPYPYTGYSGDRCMPSHEYPDGMNLYIPRTVKTYLTAHGVTTPVLAAGKIATREMAEGLLAAGEADLIGMARRLLADPDLPRKWRDGQADKVVNCIYCNVCKSLDENFREVRCFLWPKDSRHAPDVHNWSVPAWPLGADLKAEARSTAVRLSWTKASAEVKGYDIFRSPDGATWERIWGGHLAGYTDAGAIAGHTWHYMIQAFDAAGNRSALSNVAVVELPLPDFTLASV